MLTLENEKFNCKELLKKKKRAKSIQAKQKITSEIVGENETIYEQIINRKSGVFQKINKADQLLAR